MVGEFELPGGFTLLVRGPGSVEVLDGDVEVFGAPLDRGSGLRIPEGRVIPLEARKDSFVRSSAEGMETLEGTAVPRIWEEMAEEALDRKVVMAMGTSDMGKSSMILYMVNRALRAGRRPAVVDADIGQTDIGPPGTIGLAFPQTPAPTYSGFGLSDAYFIGDKSPAGHLLPMIVGSRLMVNEALSAGAAPVFVNTTGLVEGSVGWALKVHKVEVLMPDMLIAVQREAELEPVLRSIPRGMNVKRVRPPGALRKDRGSRIRYRVMSLASFAEGRTRVEVGLNGIRVVNARTLLMADDGILKRKLEAATGARPELAGASYGEAVAIFRERLDQRSFAYALAVLKDAGEARIVTMDRLRGLYLGFLDRHDRFIGVGRLLELDLRTGVLRGEAKISAGNEIGGVVFGSLILDDDWQEMDSIRPGYL